MLDQFFLMFHIAVVLFRTTHVASFSMLCISDQLYLEPSCVSDIIGEFEILPQDKKPDWCVSRSRAEIKNAVLEFLKYIYLVIQNPNKRIVPSQIQDDVWHQFMLLPTYYDFCMKNAGFLIGHNKGGSLTAEQTQLLYLETQVLWKSTYDQSHPAISMGSSFDNAATCYNVLGTASQDN